MWGEIRPFKGITEMFSPLALLVLSPFLLTIVAKVISSTKGDEGKMSRAYKEKFPKNKKVYKLFGLAILSVVVIMSWQEASQFLAELPSMVRKVGEIVLIIMLGISCLSWIVTEVFREDFPWGIFRVFERIFYLFVLGIGVSFVTSFLVAVLGRHSELFGTIFSIIGLIVGGYASLMSIPYVLKFADEYFLVLRFPNKEKRDAYKEERRRLELEAFWKEMERKRPYMEASTDWFGRDYKGRDEKDGHKLSLRKTIDGKFVDEKGNYYEKKEDK